MVDKVITRGEWCTPWTAEKNARNFILGVKAGELRFCPEDFAKDGESIHGVPSGFVYFITIGSPYPTHVKIGFTSSDPDKRLASLQTGCPYPMTMLGFVMGSMDQEKELHSVLRDDHAHGEWFVFSDYTSEVIRGVLTEDISE